MTYAFLAFMAFIAFIAFLGAAAAAFAAFLAILLNTGDVGLNRECECHSRPASFELSPRRNVQVQAESKETSSSTGHSIVLVADGGSPGLNCIPGSRRT